MSPSRLFLVIFAAVACGIAAAPYVGIAAAAGGVLLVIAIALVIAFLVLKVAMHEIRNLAIQVAESIKLYFRAIPKAWRMLVGSSETGAANSLKNRIDGLIALFVALVWAVVVVCFVLLLVF